MVCKELKRIVFEIGSIKKAWADLITTTHESPRITDNGKRKRTASEADLHKLETELCDTLAPANALATKRLYEIVDAENYLWQETAGILKCEWS